MVWELFRARARADAQREPFSCIPGVEDILSGCDIILKLFERVSFIGVDGRMSISDVPSSNPMIANISLGCSQNKMASLNAAIGIAIATTTPWTPRHAENTR